MGRQRMVRPFQIFRTALKLRILEIFPDATEGDEKLVLQVMDANCSRIPATLSETNEIKIFYKHLQVHLMLLVLVCLCTNSSDVPSYKRVICQNYKVIFYYVIYNLFAMESVCHFKVVTS